MERFTQLLGVVASYGVRANSAAFDLVHKTVEEFSFLVCQKTGVSFEFLTQLSPEIVHRVTSGETTEISRCRGKTKGGSRCKKRVFLDYCEAHQSQGDALDCKRRRIELYVGRPKKPRAPHVVPHAHFSFS